MEKYNRNHFLTVIDDFVSSLIKSIIPLFVLFAGRLREKGDTVWSGIIASAVLAAVLLSLVIFAILKWYKNVYYINNNFVVTRSGLFVVKRREIPFNKIQTINISQNIIQRIFNLAEMKIDTGNSTSNVSEVSIRIKKADAEKIKESILGFKDRNRDVGVTADEIPEGTGVDTVGAAYGSAAATGHGSAVGSTNRNAKKFTISNKELFISGLTSNAVFAGFAFLATLYGLLNDYLSSILDNSLKSVNKYIGSLNFGEMELSRIILLVGTIFLLFLIFSFVLSILGTYVKYYGFSVTREGRNIIITYGLLEKKSYSIPAAKIKAVYVRQNLTRQLAGLYTIYVESIGYGNEKGEEAMLFPIAAGLRRTELITELLPGYLFEGEIIHVPKTALRRFIISYSLLPLLIFISLTLIFPYGWLSLIIMPAFIMAGFMEYKNSAIGTNSRLICLNNGAFTKSTSLVAFCDIQSTTEKSNFMQRRKWLFNYSISIQGNVFGKTILVKNLSASLKELLMGLI